MQKLIELKYDETILVSSKIEYFLKPDYVYLPVTKEDKLLVKPDEKVKIGSKITSQSLSPISGVVKKIAKMNSVDKAIYYIEIANDFEERRLNEAMRKKKITKEEVLNFLTPKLKDLRNLILSAIDDEIYVVTQNFYLFLYYDSLLEILDEIQNMFCIDRIIVCLKASSSENINKLMSDLGMYPNIELKIVPDLYLLGKSNFLINYLGLNISDTKVIKASELNDAYNYLRRNRCLSEKLITISGNAITNPIVVQTKIGSLLEEILKDLIELKEKDCLYFANGLMQGYEINPHNFIITSQINSILVMKKNKVFQSGKCLNCGACNDICPLNLYPNLFKNKNYYNKKKDLCLKCGLCSYICPVHINFKKGVNND